MKLLDKLNNAIEGELQAYSQHKDDRWYGYGILEGRKEFAEQLWNLINEEETK